MEREKGFEICRGRNSNMAMSHTNSPPMAAAQRFPAEVLADVSGRHRTPLDRVRGTSVAPDAPYTQWSVAGRGWAFMSYQFPHACKPKRPKLALVA
jgi:hypothetical protein